jgi:hypothetical protein
MAERDALGRVCTGIQTEDTGSGKRALVYEKIEDATRCALIRMVCCMGSSGCKEAGTFGIPSRVHADPSSCSKTTEA